MEPILLQPLILLRPIRAPGADGPTPPEASADAAIAPTTAGDIAPPAGGAPRTAWIAAAGRVVATACSRLFGAVSLIIGLAVLAAIPIVQFLALGYLLESAGRIARSGRLRDAFPGVRLASRLGGIVLGLWLVTLPWRYAGVLASDAALIDPGSTQTVVLRRMVLAFAVLTPLHSLFAVSRGGRLRYFFRPIQNMIWAVRRIRAGGYFRETCERAKQQFASLRLKHYFSLGVRGFVGAAAWLVVPTTLIAAGRANGVAVLGGLLLVIVLLYLPFLQVHFSAENRLRAMFEVRAVRERFRRAPIAFFCALIVTLLLALPLYLLKIEVVPRDALWLPALVFIVTIFPMKILTGWAYARAGRRVRPAWLITRFGCRLLMIPVAVFYAFVVFLTQYTGWHGVASLYEHHAFLLPVPF